jgi:hypothetical protein
VIDLPLAPVVEEPFEHVMVPDFLPRDIYERAAASFPVCEQRGGPTSYSAFWGDPDFDRLVVEDDAWRELFESFQSQAFVDYCVRQFGDVFRKHGCLVDLDRASFVRFLETREEKSERHMSGPRPAPDQLWVRVDLLQGRNGYDRQPHLDHRRRLISMLIYMCDAEQLGMQGGDLVLNGGAAGRPNVRAASIVRPKHNLMVAFPCVPHSWHSVSPTQLAGGYRNFIQVALSSSEDAWAA